LISYFLKRLIRQNVLTGFDEIIEGIVYGFKIFQCFQHKAAPIADNVIQNNITELLFLHQN